MNKLQIPEVLRSLQPFLPQYRSGSAYQFWLAHQKGLSVSSSYFLHFHSLGGNGPPA
jgi:hypothetical protein